MPSGKGIESGEQKQEPAVPERGKASAKRSPGGGGEDVRERKAKAPARGKEVTLST